MMRRKEIIRFKTARVKKELKEDVILVLTGIIAGAVCGFFGGGGGSVIVPSLTFFLAFEQKKAQATAVPIMLSVSALSALVYLKNGAYIKDITLFCALGSVLGGVLGSFALPKISNKILSVVFYGSMIYAGVKTVGLI